MTEALKRIIKKRPGVVNVLESVVVIILSVGMIITPSIHHAHLHIIILGIELILEIAFGAAEDFLEKHRKKTLVKDAAEKTLSDKKGDEEKSA